MHLQDALGRFQVQLRADGRSEHTRKQYERHVRGLIDWLGTANQSTDIEELSPAAIAEFLASDAATGSARGGAKKASSTNAMRTSIRCFARWAHESGLVASNPARLLRRARCTPPPPKGLHDDERTRLLEVLKTAEGCAGERDGALILLLLHAGIRIGSAIGLDIEDVDFEHGELHLRSGKNNARSTVVLPAAVADQLRKLIGERTTGPVFTAGERRISIRNAQRRIAGWFEAAGIRGKSAHSLRHSFATALLGRTGDLRLVQNALGHRSIVSTTVYAQVDRGRLRAAVGA
ncbi:MAG: tyrosine-type recombinase/integrase [Planctomycetes bacterium]|nr:tyrosine-type recombinase/integrase [Planctomycetota bacterium]